MLRTLLLSLLFGVTFSAFPQSKAPDDPVPAPRSGIQSQNILDVKPEVKRDASSDPAYFEQNNAQRNAVQPGNNAPMWRGVAAGLEGTTSLPRSQAPEAGILIQAQVRYPGSRLTTAGEAWRQVRGNWLIPYGGGLLLIVLGAIALYFVAKGPIGDHGATDGHRRIERFSPFERSAHWVNAIAFCLLAISGLVMAFGKFVLLPLMGSGLFGWITYALKTLHNFAGPVFAVSLVVVFLTFVRDNWPQRGDWGWLRKGGGMFGKSRGLEPPSHRFNAGEKMVFWLGVFALGCFVVSSGLVMDQLIPDLVYDRGTMQVAHMVHNTAALLMMCLFAGHIYIGTIGMRGAYAAMRHGWVGDDWAREHHAYWLQAVDDGIVSAQRSLAPPEAEATRLAGLTR